MRKTRHRSDAFTLLEVLVALAVLAIVLMILLGMLSSSMSLWRNTENKLIADREGRAANLLIAQDLAGAILPAEPSLWPRVQNNCLQFLSVKPPDYQKVDDGDIGDVCYVEYFLSDDKAALLRNYYGSAWTYENVLKNRQFRAAPVVGDAQIVSTNLLANMSDAVRGMVLADEASDVPFAVIMSDTMLAHGGGAYDADNPPVAVEMNVAAADPQAIANKDLLNNNNYKLRNAGLYSTRIALPAPSQQ